VKVHYLPKYSPDTNPIERVWWRLHEAVTRNYRCQSMTELLDLTFDWFETRIHFRVQHIHEIPLENEHHFRCWRGVSSVNCGVTPRVDRNAEQLNISPG